MAVKMPSVRFWFFWSLVWLQSDDQAHASCNYNSSKDYDPSYFFYYNDELKVTADNQLGTVSMDDPVVISFDLVVHSIYGNDYHSIFHMGSSNSERSPGIWLNPSASTLHLRISDSSSWNSGYGAGDTLDFNIWYNIKITACDGTITYYLDDVSKTSYDRTIDSRTDTPVYGSDPWWDAANVTIKNIVIQPCM